MWKHARRLVIVSFIVFGVTNSAWAHEATLTKDSPKLIYVQGEASRSVPVDGARLTWTFPTEKGSFTDAGEAGRAIVDQIQKNLGELQGPNVSVIYGWDLLRQSKISWSTKGRRVDHKLVVELETIPPGKLHELVAQAIDRSLQTSDKLELEHVEVYLTDAKEQEAKTALFKEASKIALANAQGIASAFGSQLVGPRYVFASSNVSTDPRHLDSNGYASQAEAAASYSLSLKKSFKVNADLPDRMELSVSVVGAFEIQ